MEEAQAAADAQHGGSQQQQPPPSPQDRAKALRISNGTTFLNNPQVKTSPLSRRVNFLKSKGLSAEEIVEAFQRAGQPQSLDSIQAIINSAPPPAAATPAIPSTTAAIPSATAANRVAVVAAQQQPNYQQQPPVQPYTPQHPPLPHAPSWTWKDAVIGAGVACLATFGAAKAVEHYSPWEVRRKDTAPNAAPLPSSASRKDPRRGSSGSPTSKSSGSSKRQPLSATASSAEDSTIDDMPPASRRGQSSRPAAAQPALPLPPAATAPAVDPKLLEAQTKIQDLEGQLARMNAELTETKTSLDKERKDRAELAVNSAKLKGQVQQQSRTNEKNVAEIARLQTQVIELQSSGRGTTGSGGTADVPPTTSLAHSEVPPAATDAPVVTAADGSAGEVAAPALDQLPPAAKDETQQ